MATRQIEADRQTDTQTGRQRDRQTCVDGSLSASHRYIGGVGHKTERQTERQTDRETDRPTETDRQADRQADRETDRQTDLYRWKPLGQPQVSGMKEGQ